MKKMTLKPLLLGGWYPLKTIRPPILVVHTKAETHTKSRLAEKAKAVQISTLEVPVVVQRQSVLERLSGKDVGPKTWAEHDLRKVINFAIVGKAISHTPRVLSRKSLGERSVSSFTQRIVDAPPPKKLSAPKLHIYNGRSDPADHIRYY